MRVAYEPIIFLVITTLIFKGDDFCPMSTLIEIFLMKLIYGNALMHFRFFEN